MSFLSSLELLSALKSSEFFLFRKHFVLYVFTYCCSYLCCSLVTECSLLPSSIYDKDCSEQRFLYGESSGRISSPNFPFSYPPNKKCEWRIQARRYEHIILSFPVFQINGGSGPLCHNDHIEIHDISLKDTLVGNFCREHLPPAHFITTGSEARIVLHSNKQRDPAFGVSKFEILYSKPVCGGNLTALQGSLTSPNFPNPYPSDRVCTWLITVPNDLVITLHFSTFDLEPKSTCVNDYVDVLDGKNQNSQQIGRYCSSESPPSVIRSTGSEMRVTFKSFATTTSVGFRAGYETVQHCGGVLKGESGSFTSPGYEIKYTRDLTTNYVCTWIMSVEKYSIVSLNFRVFDIPSKSNSTHDCLSNYVEIFDGLKSTSKLIGRFCNNARPHNNLVRASGQFMMFRFRIDATFIGKGFYATYITVDPHDLYDKCTLIGKTNSLLFPCKNGIYIDCEWRCDGTDDCDDGSDELHCPCSDGSNDSNCDKDKPKNNAEPYVITILATMVTAVLLCITVFVIERVWRTEEIAKAFKERAQHFSRTPFNSMIDNLSPPPPYSAELDGEDLFSFESTCALPPSYVAEETSEIDVINAVSSSATASSIQQSSESTSRTETACISDVSSSVYDGTVCETEIQGDGDSVSISSNENQPLIVST